jgi:hypothetical protein
MKSRATSESDTAHGLRHSATATWDYMPNQSESSNTEMTESGLTMPDKKGGIDPAALAVAALAAAVSVIAPPGPYGPACMMIGATILCVIFAYDVEPSRGRGKNLAFSAVCALISLLTLGFLLECAFAKNKAMRLHLLLAEPEHDIEHSEVPPLVILCLWIVAWSGHYWLDRWRCKQAAKKRKAQYKKLCIDSGSGSR